MGKDDGGQQAELQNNYFLMSLTISAKGYQLKVIIYNSISNFFNSLFLR